MPAKSGEIMKILWVCNTLPSEISEQLFNKAVISGGWITGMAGELVKNGEAELVYAGGSPYCKDYITEKFDNLKYYIFPSGKSCGELSEYFLSLLNNEKPDLVHIFGSEYIHAYSMICACEQYGIIGRTIISIQGLVSVCAKHYCSGIPINELKRKTLRDYLRKGGILNGQKRFKKAGEYEIKAIEKAEHIIGRTDWDYICTKRLNRNVQYHFCNETLRNAFYSPQKWNYGSCHKHTIFANYGGHIVKGFHFLLEAMPDILKVYPDTMLYVTGSNPLDANGFMAQQRQTNYVNYIGRLIKKYHLESRIVFTGLLSEEEMRKQYLNANVFVSASVIENSPNSVGEAMLLGTPVVVSDVGGVKNLLAHGTEGYVYQGNAPYMLAGYVMKIFELEDKAELISENAILHAEKIYNKENNYKQLMEIYNSVYSNNYEEVQRELITV